MASSQEKRDLKRGRESVPEGSELKKPRRSERLTQQFHGSTFAQHLPSPVTAGVSDEKEHHGDKERTAEPEQASHLKRVRTPPAIINSVTTHGLNSPPSDTQPFSQFYQAPPVLTQSVQDEEAEGVWGYLLPLDNKFGSTLVLRRRTACPVPQSRPLKVDGKSKVAKDEHERNEERYEKSKIDGTASSGYLIGRHPECDRILDIPTVSNRHCLLFCESKSGKDVAVLEDLSGNGTFVNQSIVGRNKRRELCDGDEISILDAAHFVFRYSRTRSGHGFNQQYAIQTQLGKGHFATVYLCVERNTGMKFAVKKFDKRHGPGERSKVEGLQQEIAVLMGISHPNLLCLKDVFDEDDGVYLVLELAVEGELFNWIVMKSKLTEDECRKIFIQLFQGLKYLHERNIVHRDVKPENILLVDQEAAIKLADFGLAKIIGEESFTTTLCGTPSYVAPEVLESSNHRRYTKAVDIWSAGVVLYICLCGFPPFSDELYTTENPYTLSQQIKLGRFDYPSPYWDPVSDLALDLIDKMLTVSVEKRISIDDCLQHPWITRQGPSNGSTGHAPLKNATDSTDGLTGAMLELDFSKRKPQRERTLLSSINDLKLAKTIETQKDADPVKVWTRNEDGSSKDMQRGKHSQHANGNGKAESKAKSRKNEPRPADFRHPDDFAAMGGVGDRPLYANDGNVNYVPQEVEDSLQEIGVYPEQQA